MNATQLANGVIQLPDALWAQLPPGAQNAITTHNNTVGGASTQANMHTLMCITAQMNRMSNATQQVFDSAPPPGNPNQYQQFNAHGQAPGTTLPHMFFS